MGVPFPFRSSRGFPEDCPYAEANKVKGALLFCPFRSDINGFTVSKSADKKYGKQTSSTH